MIRTNSAKLVREDPPELFSCLPRVADQQVHFRRTMQLRIGHHMIAVIQPARVRMQPRRSPAPSGFRRSPPHNHPARPAAASATSLPRSRERAPNRAAHPDCPAGLASTLPRRYCSRTRADFPRHEFMPAPRRLVIEQNSATRIHPVSFPVIARQVETRHLADPVRRPRMEPRRLHSAESRPPCRTSRSTRQNRNGNAGAASFTADKHEMRPVDVTVQRGELVVERVTHEALRRQMITLIGLHPAHNLMQARKALQRSGVQHDPVPDSGDPLQTVLRDPPTRLGAQCHVPRTLSRGAVRPDKIHPDR